MTTKTRTMIQQQRSQSTKQQIETLQRYMSEAEASALAGMYEHLELTTHRLGDSKVTIVTVSASDIHATYQHNGWLPDGHAIPQPGDWGVVINYVKKTLAESSEWVEVFREDGYMHGDLLSNIAEKYNINL